MYVDDELAADQYSTALIICHACIHLKALKQTDDENSTYIWSLKVFLDKFEVCDQ